jgi:hypothetical protein
MVGGQVVGLLLGLAGVVAGLAFLFRKTLG